MKVCVFVLLLIVWPKALAADVLISDTRDAYERVFAMKGLLAQVNQRIQSIQSDYEKAVAPLATELQTLRQTAGQHQKRKAALLIQIAQLQKRAAADQQIVGSANEKALAQIEAAITRIEAELKSERAASAVLRAQDALYFNAACACNITEEIYRRLNARLPSITLP
jgi:Skp family chaperone for outer membrane proteins